MQYQDRNATARVVRSMPQRRVTEMVGTTVGRLCIKGIVYKQRSWGNIPYFECKCVCGNTVEVLAYSLTRQLSSSCGCYQREETSKRRKSHGQSHTRVYRIWRGMIDRCERETSPQYHRYGGRGITVCVKWKESFTAFMEDVGPRPSNKHSLERIDNDGPYSPDNCRWATQTEQCNNTRKNLMIAWQGKTQSVARWAEELGIPRHRLYGRIRNGWTVDEMMSHPSRVRENQGWREKSNGVDVHANDTEKSDVPRVV